MRADFTKKNAGSQSADAGEFAVLFKPDLERPAGLARLLACCGGKHGSRKL
jgi:hypothetical protein